MTETTDHFSRLAEQYASYRPDYPPGLFGFLANSSAAQDLAWDCGAGTGQAAAGLAARFRRVIATDVSWRQLSQARPVGNVAYVTARAEAVPLGPASVDLVTVAQALHWFDLPAFYGEVRRVLRPGGSVAVWTYQLCQLGPELDPLVQHLYGDVLGAYWPEERRLVEDGYASLDFPFAEIPAPEFFMQANWTLEAFLGYLGSWSAGRYYQRATGSSPLDTVAAEMARHWGEPDTRRRVRWPLRLRLGRWDG